MAALAVKQAELAAVLKKLADLDTDLAEKVARKESLEAEVEMCKVKLARWACGCTHAYIHVHACMHVRELCNDVLDSGWTGRCMQGYLACHCTFTGQHTVYNNTLVCLNSQ
jgi:hypothetical protein